jgi:hypothetical protein
LEVVPHGSKNKEERRERQAPGWAPAFENRGSKRA